MVHLWNVQLISRLMSKWVPRRKLLLKPAPKANSKLLPVNSGLSGFAFLALWLSMRVLMAKKSFEV